MLLQLKDTVLFLICNLNNSVLKRIFLTAFAIYQRNINKLSPFFLQALKNAGKFTDFRVKNHDFRLRITNRRLQVLGFHSNCDSFSIHYKLFSVHSRALHLQVLKNVNKPRALHLHCLKNVNKPRALHLQSSKKRSKISYFILQIANFYSNYYSSSVVRQLKLTAMDAAP